MGKCMKDHPIEDVMEKIDDVKEYIEEDVVEELTMVLEKNRLEQASLNELFHMLKRLEKNVAEEEKVETIEKIRTFLKV